MNPTLRIGGTGRRSAPGVDRSQSPVPALPGPPPIGGDLSPGRFRVSLLGITTGALALRVAYVLAYTRYQNGTTYDSYWYYITTIGLRSGQFFRAPFSYAPSAAHPPVTSLLLGAAAYVVGLPGGTTSSLLVMAVMGAGWCCASACSGEPWQGPGSGSSPQASPHSRRTSGCRAAS